MLATLWISGCSSLHSSCVQTCAQLRYSFSRLMVQTVTRKERHHVFGRCSLSSYLLPEHCMISIRSNALWICQNAHRQAYSQHYDHVLTIARIRTTKFRPLGSPKTLFVSNLKWSRRGYRLYNQSWKMMHETLCSYMSTNTWALANHQSSIVPWWAVTQVRMIRDSQDWWYNAEIGTKALL